VANAEATSAVVAVWEPLRGNLLLAAAQSSDWFEFKGRRLRKLTGYIVINTLNLASTTMRF